MSTHIGQDHPFVEDAGVQAAGVALGSLRSALVGGIKAIAASHREQPVGEAFRLVLPTLLRMSETSLSLEFLISKCRERDAAILLLTLMELRLDLRYVARSPSRASAWLANADVGRKRWSARKQIKEISSSQAEREAELDFYQRLSMIKHGNPVGGFVAFSAEFVDDATVLIGDASSSLLLATYLFAAGCYLRDGFDAAIAIGYSENVQLRSIVDRLNDALARISAVLNACVTAPLNDMRGRLNR